MESSDEQMPNRRLSLNEMMFERARKHEVHFLDLEEVKEEGWRCIDLNDNQQKVSFEPPVIDNVQVCARVGVHHRSSPFDIFLQFFPVDFVKDLWEEILKDYPEVIEPYSYYFVLLLF